MTSRARATTGFPVARTREHRPSCTARSARSAPSTDPLRSKADCTTPRIEGSARHPRTTSHRANLPSTHQRTPLVYVRGLDSRLQNGCRRSLRRRDSGDPRGVSRGFAHREGSGTGHASLRPCSACLQAPQRYCRVQSRPFLRVGLLAHRLIVVEEPEHEDCHGDDEEAQRSLRLGRGEPINHGAPRSRSCLRTSARLR